MNTIFAMVCASLFLFQGDYQKERARMVADQIRARGVRDAAVLAAMESVERHRFVPKHLRHDAYEDHPLPIGHGQTISQPYIVAAMTEMLRVDSDSVVLEVGTGSGYQAAILARIVKRVYTLEVIAPLARRAVTTLRENGMTNVTVKEGDGYYGWAEKGPFDGIVVTAAASHIPPPLVDQLKPGGWMVIPVGPVFAVQSLMLVHKREDGTITKKKVMSVRFVPLTGNH
ncbi:protein-L-isoaspartate(D-aspartate) O-methyltransferase [Sulfidibacter corallicola]|uniref:Protein-L-isoaspartate O-methyltransferase n=1 Tax=Sulfidibacter corallicola TaxID=2818388 RepID=A0A8A4TFX1_SULCO|nr:protein-L-isoaspartate(D-aspartate) O-methyltransferase [Sulfidibacter corallicola]QTD47608.1 protein-L-isoaspartate(D-aspartate) O-methyltransferase [Sulfidibacter corallicola]